MSFEKIVKDISSLKIQGAENIAKAAVSSLLFVLKKNQNNTSEHTLAALKKASSVLSTTRPTEPCLINALHFLFSDLDNKSKTPSRKDFEIIFKSRISAVLDFFDSSEKKIDYFGSQKIKPHSRIFTHCHSSTVMSILKSAWSSNKNFEVHNTETRPMFQGRITAKELSKEGIPVFHYVDSAARLAIKRADLMLLGADAITSEGCVINKIGSELFAETARRFDVPVYVCSHSWKFDPLTVFGFDESIEKRFSKEVWSTPPKGVKINNFAFEKIEPALITGVITELGIYRPEVIAQLLQKKYAWMFENR
jgi:ribose 1,5-bisphosphate isomerase